MPPRPEKTRTSRDGGASRFVGRESALEKIAEALARGRLVELIGPPGVGKTRLATEFAKRSPRLSVLRFCDLTEAASLSAFLFQVARSLGVPVPLDISPDELARRVRERVFSDDAMLLVLDNFEQLPASADAALAAWFEGEGPGARVLVTSRRRLAGAPATTLSLAPLSTERRSGEPWSEAAELLVARGSAFAGGSFDPQEDRATMEDLARELDGLPLALELAASRFRVLAPKQVLARLSQRFRMLRRPDGTIARANLRESIEMSYVMLAPPEQEAFLASSVFRGGFSLDAADAVLGEEGGPWPLDLLESLLDQSMLTVDQDPHERRYDLLICIREFAESELAQRGGGAARAAERHARYYVGLGERLVGCTDAGSRRALERERENLTAIVHRRGLLGADLALRAALVLAAPASGLPYITVEELLGGALGDDEGEGASPALVGRALLSRGTVRRFLGRLPESAADLERARGIGASIGDHTLLAEAFAGLGNTVAGVGDWGRARAFFERALEACAEPRLRARLLAMLANSFGGTDEYDRAIPLFRQSIAETDRAGDESASATARLALGVILLAAGDFDEASRLLGDALEALTRIGSPHWEGITLSYLARCKQETGDLPAALTLYSDALARLDAAGVRRAQAVAFYQFATALIEAGELSAAAKHLRTALPLARENCGEYEGVILAAQGVVAARRGAAGDAAMLYRRAEASLSAYPKPMFLAAVRVLLGDEPPAAFASCSEVRLALRLRSPVPAPRTAPPLLIARDGSWFRAPGSDASIPLERRKALRGVLRALLRQREERPGEAATVAALVEAGWPGERILASAGTERVYAAVATLRRLGLQGVIQQKAGGYLLSPEIPVVLS
ncbi:ATP-binding protein [Polyangium jinanense]|uniref:Tetratricopeptide repeat protein n=1 Tax=Polyangium jinanense TaxID=2829994 RepID=A0A9X3XIY7_9BACT|nr:tetratricopeptide repeat protein [Polyangium jinanense]MDC3989051.1 tetratricopeptide repeat protein [Polyangium jinanense]